MIRSILLRRPSPALVVACLALGVALGGTSYATVLQAPRSSIGTPQLKNGAVTTPKLAANSVTSAKVRNRSLLRVDFASGQLPAGPTGPTGPAGPAGPAGAPGLSAVERVEVTSVTNSTPSRTAQMPCPTGKRLIGGGARLNPGLPQVALQASFPDNDNVYRATAREIVSTGSTWSLTVFAICATTAG
jgi:hypothetical protein